jgi:hypothetical protein
LQVPSSSLPASQEPSSHPRRLSGLYQHRTFAHAPSPDISNSGESLAFLAGAATPVHNIVWRPLAPLVSSLTAYTANHSLCKGSQTTEQGIAPGRQLSVSTDSTAAAIASSAGAIAPRQPLQSPPHPPKSHHRTRNDRAVRVGEGRRAHRARERRPEYRAKNISGFGRVYNCHNPTPISTRGLKAIACTAGEHSAHRRSCNSPSSFLLQQDTHWQAALPVSTDSTSSSVIAGKVQVRLFAGSPAVPPPPPPESHHCTQTTERSLAENTIANEHTRLSPGEQMALGESGELPRMRCIVSATACDRNFTY